jgi:hypothetical protein
MGIKSLRIVAVAGLAAGVVIGLAPAASAAPTQHGNGPAHLISHGVNASQSTNWSGYAETGSGFTSATANWTVPSVSSSSSATYSSAWVGIDGDGNQNLIQTGTESDYYSGKAHYDAWWEILPAAETVITGITVHPGDSFTGTVAKVSGTTWKITLKDNTTGVSFSSNKTYRGAGASVEYIQEAPEVGGSIAKIAHFSKFSFSGLTVNGHSPALKSADEILLVQSGHTYSTPSAPNSGGNGFSVSYTG